MDVEVRFAQEKDLSTILYFVRELASHEKMLYEVITDEETLKYSLFGHKPAAEVIIATYEGEAVGCAVFFQNFSTFTGRRGIYLEDIFVEPQFRRQGVAKKMLKFLAQAAIKRGCTRVEWIVADENEKAKDFYQRLGAKKAGVWHSHRLVDDQLVKLASS